MIRCKRVYDPPSGDDGWRVLVDRLWPRGVRKDDLRPDAWCKDAAPSTELRRWYRHDTSLHDTFAERYRAELAARPEHWLHLLDHARRGNLTLLYAARDPRCNHARVLADFLEDELAGQDEPSSPVCYAKH